MKSGRRQPRAARASRPGGAARGGFVLPLVLLVGIVLAVLMTVMIERFTAQAATVRLSLTQYESHHLGKGAAELIDEWMREVSRTGRGALRERLADDGLALEVNLPGGLSATSHGDEVMRLYLKDVQTSLLQSSGDQPLSLREALERAQTELEATYGVGGAKQYLRSQGPAAVSVLTASETVLTALVNGVTQQNGTAAVVAALLAAREDGKVSQAEINEAIAAGGLDPQQRVLLAQLLTAEPSLWEVRAEVSDRETGRRLARYLGTTTLSIGRADRSARGNSPADFMSRSYVRDWRRDDAAQ